MADFHRIFFVFGKDHKKMIINISFKLNNRLIFRKLRARSREFKIGLGNEKT